MHELISLNVGLPRDVRHGEQVVRTGVLKQPVTGPCHLGKLGLEDDGQADLEDHGGPAKAAYA